MLCSLRNIMHWSLYGTIIGVIYSCVILDNECHYCLGNVWHYIKMQPLYNTDIWAKYCMVVLCVQYYFVAIICFVALICRYCIVSLYQHCIVQLFYDWMEYPIHYHLSLSQVHTSFNIFPQNKYEWQQGKNYCLLTIIPVSSNMPMPQTCKPKKPEICLYGENYNGTVYYL